MCLLKRKEAGRLSSGPASSLVGLISSLGGSCVHRVRVHLYRYPLDPTNRLDRCQHNDQWFVVFHRYSPPFFWYLFGTEISSRVRENGCFVLVPYLLQCFSNAAGELAVRSEQSCRRLLDCSPPLETPTTDPRADRSLLRLKGCKWQDQW